MPHAASCARDFATGLAAAGRGGRPRRPRLPRPRDVLDAGRHARARLLLRLRRAAGHADGPRRRRSARRDGRQHVGPRAGWRARCASTARSASPTGSRARSSAAASARRSTTTFELVDAITAAMPAPARFAGGHPAKRTFQAIRIAVNDELGQLEAALPRGVGAAARRAGGSPRSRFHSLEDRRVKRFLADRTRGCICPPDLPVCGCGRTPEAELIFRRSVAPTAGEVADNPRSKSARLRAARKLAGGSAVTPATARARRRAPSSRTAVAAARAAARLGPRSRPGSARAGAGPRRRRGDAPARADRHHRRLRAAARAARAPHGRPPPARPGVDLADRARAARDRRDAGLAAQAQRRHLARGRGVGHARAPERRPRGHDRPSVARASASASRPSARGWSCPRRATWATSPPARTVTPAAPRRA